MSRAPAAGEESWLDRNRSSESSRRDWRDEDRPEPAPEACVVCRADGIDLNDQGECAECAPREDETCEEWEERMKGRRG